MSPSFKALVFDLFGVLVSFDDTDTIVPIKKGIDLLNACKKSKLSLYILSNAKNDTLKLLQKKYPDIFRGFKDIISSQDAQAKKPMPEIFNYLLSKHQLSAEDCVFIDDSQENVDSAQQLGFAAIYHTSSEKTLAQLKKINILS